MKHERAAGKEGCDPNHLLDALIEKMRVEDDAALADKLQVTPLIISMLREERISVSPSLLLWMQDACGIGIEELRALLQR